MDIIPTIKWFQPFVFDFNFFSPYSFFRLLLRTSMQNNWLLPSSVVNIVVYKVYFRSLFNVRPRSSLNFLTDKDNMTILLGALQKSAALSDYKIKLLVIPCNEIFPFLKSFFYFLVTFLDFLWWINQEFLMVNFNLETTTVERWKILQQ